jgi:hypothetical protein
MEATIKLTKRMLDKSEINANKTVQQFLSDDFGLEYTDPFFQRGLSSQYLVSTQTVKRYT